MRGRRRARARDRSVRPTKCRLPSHPAQAQGKRRHLSPDPSRYYNPAVARAERDYSIEITCPEFTSVCPKTGQPDFGAITYTYTPDRQCVELKSLKLYLQRFRNQGIFYEDVVNRLLEDFVQACRPRRCEVVGAFTPRGGITTTVMCVYEAAQDKRS